MDRDEVAMTVKRVALWESLSSIAKGYSVRRPNLISSIGLFVS